MTAGPEDGGRPPRLDPRDEPPETAERREREWAESGRDMRPAVGSRGAPASWVPEDPGAGVPLAEGDFGDARWSFLYKPRDTRYAATEPRPGEIADANRRMRAAGARDVRGPFIKGPVWTWEVPIYFWVGGVASGSGFVAFACDVAGDHRSAAIARRVALAAVAPAAPFLIADLGRPGRFLNMLRVFKPRSPMNMGAWCLAAFSGATTGAIAADIAGRPRAARALGALTSVLGGYLGSYTGVLLACTAVPLWARSRLFLGPIFVATATATGAAATRLVLVARGLPEDHPSRNALATLETASIVTELSLSAINERRLGDAAESLRRGRPGMLFRGAKYLVALGLSTRLAGRRGGPRFHDAASLMYLAGGLAFRFAWVYAGKASAADHRAVAAMGRAGAPGTRALSASRRPLATARARRAWGEALRRTSLALERFVRPR